MSTAKHQSNDVQQPLLNEALPEYRSILLALDSSDHANRGIEMALRLAVLNEGVNITGTHVFAAKMHDLRFRQMEGGLPEQFREEHELERQRDVHDDLIKRGLSIITDSYLQQAERACSEKNICFTGKPLEGKNYRALTDETNSGAYDLLIIGALGLGAIKSSRIGTVCNRVVRRAGIDTLVIKSPQRGLSDSPIVAAIDGSTHAFGGLLTALKLAQSWHVPLHVISSFDPYYHYVAFNRIAGVLSEEASKVFRFRAQEKLHEDIIDSGLAKIYAGHLMVAQSIADEHGIEIHTQLLDGKAHDVVEKYVRTVNPSLLVIGKLGVHADKELDIGGNAENLLQNVDCSLLLSQRRHQPRIDVLAEAGTSWTHEAEQRLARSPGFVRNMARTAILRYAQERGHTVITARLVDEATSQLMPGRAEDMLTQLVDSFDHVNRDARITTQRMEWASAATTMLESIEDVSLRENLKMRAEKKARAAGTFAVKPVHIEAFVNEVTQDVTSGSATAGPPLHWQAAALARLTKVPTGFMRDMSRKRIEEYARAHGHSEIDLETAEAGLDAARAAMQEELGVEGKAELAGNDKGSKCPFAGLGATESNSKPEPVNIPPVPPWTDEAREELQAVPQGYCRDMMVAAAETIAGQKRLIEIDREFIQTILRIFAAGSEAVDETLVWDDDARSRIVKAPALVRGMLVKEIEGWTKRNDLTRVTEGAVEAVRQQWTERGVFHLDPDDPRSSEQST